MEMCRHSSFMAAPSGVNQPRDWYALEALKPLLSSIFSAAVKSFHGMPLQSQSPSIARPKEVIHGSTLPRMPSSQPSVGLNFTHNAGFCHRGFIFVSNSQSRSLLINSQSNSQTSRARIIFISMYAKLMPRHALGPSENGLRHLSHHSCERDHTTGDFVVTSVQEETFGHQKCTSRCVWCSTGILTQLPLPEHSDHRLPRQGSIAEDQKAQEETCADLSQSLRRDKPESVCCRRRFLEYQRTQPEILQ